MCLCIYGIWGNISDSFSESFITKATLNYNIAQEGGCDLFGGVFPGVGNRAVSAKKSRDCLLHCWPCTGCSDWKWPWCTQSLPCILHPTCHCWRGCRGRWVSFLHLPSVLSSRSGAGFHSSTLCYWLFVIPLT